MLLEQPLRVSQFSIHCLPPNVSCWKYRMNTGSSSKHYRWVPESIGCCALCSVQYVDLGIQLLSLNPPCTVRNPPISCGLCPAEEALWMVSGRCGSSNVEGVSLSTLLTHSFPFFDFIRQWTKYPFASFSFLTPILGNSVSEGFPEFCSLDLESPNTSGSEDWF